MGAVWEREDWPDDGDASTVACDQCGYVLRCILQRNPYTDEIHPGEENPESWWCYGCHYSACMDI